MIFKNYLNNLENIRLIKALLATKSFRNKSQWYLSFFQNLDDKFITKQTARELISVIRDTDESLIIPFERFEKYLIVYPNLFREILQVIIPLNELKQVRLTFWDDIFDKYFEFLGDSISLIEDSYIQQIELQKYYDHDSKGFKKILQKDQTFLMRYFDLFLKNYNFRMGDYQRQLSFVWSIDGIEENLTEIFEKMASREHYYKVHDEIYSSFFSNLTPEFEKIADNFLKDFARKYYSEPKKMQMVVDIARKVRRNLYEPVILLYLSMTQLVEDFKQILWRGNGGSYVGEVIIGDIEASEWRNILHIVEKSDLTSKLIPIKNYIRNKIESCLRQGDLERERRFLERW